MASSALLLLVAAAFLSARKASSLTLLSGQRIPSRSGGGGGGACSGGGGVRGRGHESTDATMPGGTKHRRASIFDLPRVERWATERGLAEHHLRTIYRVVMRSPAPPMTPPDAIGGRGDPDDGDAPSFEERLVRSDFPRKHAAALAGDFSPCTSTLVESRRSSSGGRKLVVRLPSGLAVETVVIRHARRGDDGGVGARCTVCVSSQVGCARACSFCATGTMGLRADLSSAEILEQVWLARGLIDAAGGDGDVLRNVVFMGMGEPMDNYGAVHEACRGLTHQCLFGLRGKQVTVSTVGDSPDRIRDLALEAPSISLALSLHGATRSLRTALIPSAGRVSLRELGDALDYHAGRTGRGAMLEYLLIDGVNDGDDAAEALVCFCRDRSAKGQQPFVNLIPYNPTAAGDGFGYETPSDGRIEAFHDRLRVEGIHSLVRWSSAAGRDADGACGQLALSVGGKD